MRFLVDECVSEDIASHLRQLGFDVVFVGSERPGSVDIEILRWAVEEGRIVVTMDKDFGDHIFRDGLPHRGLLLMRTGNAPTSVCIDAVNRALSASDDLTDRVVVVTETSVRVGSAE